MLEDSEQQSNEIIMGSLGVLHIIHTHQGEVIEEISNRSPELESAVSVGELMSNFETNEFQLIPYSDDMSFRLVTYRVLPADSRNFEATEPISEVKGFDCTYIAENGCAFLKEPEDSMEPSPVIVVPYYEHGMVFRSMKLIGFVGEKPGIDNSVIFQLNFPNPTIISIDDSLEIGSQQLTLDQVIDAAKLNQAHNGGMSKVMGQYGLFGAFLRVVNSVLETGDSIQPDHELLGNSRFLDYLSSDEEFAGQLAYYLKVKRAGLYELILINLREDIQKGKWRKWLQEEEDEEED